MKTVIKDGSVITMDPELGELERGDVLRENDKVLVVGPILKAHTESGMVVMPDLVNADIHTWDLARRGTGTDWISAPRRLTDGIVEYGIRAVFGHGTERRTDRLTIGKRFIRK